MPSKSRRKRNWLELPTDLMVNILQRLGVFDILENAQNVCTAWREICTDPAMWKVVYMERHPNDKFERFACEEMCREAVDRSQGQLVDLTVIGFCNNELLQYVADRSSKLRRLEIMWGNFGEKWFEALKKLSLLEELSLAGAYILQEDIEAAGRYCPLLRTLKVKERLWAVDEEEEDDDDDDIDDIDDDLIALAIGKNLPELTHLELSGSNMENVGLQAILDGCCHLEYLDLRGCVYLELNGDLGKRCSQQIKYLELPTDDDTSETSDDKY